MFVFAPLFLASNPSDSKGFRLGELEHRECFFLPSIAFLQTPVVARGFALGQIAEETVAFHWEHSDREASLSTSLTPTKKGDGSRQN